MSIEARSNILSRLRAGLGDSQPIDQSQDSGSAASYQWSQTEKVDRFINVISSVNGEVHRTSEQGWPEAVEHILKDKKINQLLVSSQKETGQKLASRSLELISSEKLNDHKDKLFFSIPAALTTCRSAIAETGSLVLWPDEQEPRSMSLVPPVHLVLLKAEDIHNTLAETIHAEGWSSGMPTNVLLVSGPSKTADIARILAYGAHGPKELIILLVE
ncbi:lactate utilization protein [Endozoicomonas sp. OPT23]|uniref:LutC/YkgG family protein n=1 Tax=Endozoicomonas sp. OPT23 TaxID=2072845 RepID=UPI00129BE99D|nr:lactate utilization protein [Endozoicomonas sp. OPT23]MRI31584.1 lactate utilization protein [Endozoicomonas sp. OPT23]